MFKKWVMIFSAVALFAAPAYAGNIPEFDAVGQDSANFFKDGIMQSVVDNVKDGFGNFINNHSDFTAKPVDPAKPAGAKMEFFENTAGFLYPDSCFPGYLSAMVDMSNSGSYTWQIVLQMKPESDIDLTIQDCVLKHNSFNVWGDAEQTGRFRLPGGKLWILLNASPQITVQAFPGKFATSGFPASGFYMDARTTPGLYQTPLVAAPYTSKALWDESIVMVMPETGYNASGQKWVALKQGDRIKVSVDVPETNTTDIFYGPDNVILKYIGIVGTEYTTLY